MDEKLNSNSPSSLVVEYKSTSLMLRGVVSLILIIALLIITDALSNMIATALLLIWFVISILWIKKAYADTALTITGSGITINNKHNIEWGVVDAFFIKTIIVDGDKAERIIIKTNAKDFRLNMEDLDVDRERLNQWIKFHNQNRRKN